MAAVRSPGGYAPDMRESQIALSREAFTEVVIGGALQMNGMPRFKHFTDKEVDGLMHYFRKMARKAVSTEVSSR